MKVFLILIISNILLVSGSFANTSADVRISSFKKGKNNNIWIRSKNKEFSAQFEKRVAQREDIMLYKSMNQNEGDEYMVGPMPYFDGARAGRDMRIGAGFCLGSCLFVYVVGESHENPPQGFSAQAGDRYLQGPMAYMAGAASLYGLWKFTKGFIELFMTSTQPPQMGLETDFPSIMKNLGYKTEDKMEIMKVSSKNMEQSLRQSMEFVLLGL